MTYTILPFYREILTLQQQSRQIKDLVKHKAKNLDPLIQSLAQKIQHLMTQPTAYQTQFQAVYKKITSAHAQSDKATLPSSQITLESLNSIIQEISDDIIDPILKVCADAQQTIVKLEHTRKKIDKVLKSFLTAYASQSDDLKIAVVEYINGRIGVLNQWKNAASNEQATKKLSLASESELMESDFLIHEYKRLVFKFADDERHFQLAQLINVLKNIYLLSLSGKNLIVEISALNSTTVTCLNYHQYTDAISNQPWDFLSKFLIQVAIHKLHTSELPRLAETEKAKIKPEEVIMIIPGINCDTPLHHVAEAILKEEKQLRIIIDDIKKHIYSVWNSGRKHPYCIVIEHPFFQYEARHVWQQIDMLNSEIIVSQKFQPCHQQCFTNKQSAEICYDGSTNFSSVSTDQSYITPEKPIDFFPEDIDALDMLLKELCAEFLLIKLSPIIFEYLTVNRNNLLAIKHAVNNYVRVCRQLPEPLSQVVNLLVLYKLLENPDVVYNDIVKSNTSKQLQALGVCPVSRRSK